eukprot:CAMPEP_0118933432 /NCGR_PEP_ID=MMETSP1169-20130426/11982_1 /TAXON_ID=36882 /ORGANISM="Pyramimonas obovata, Strain CCMP722" /LENGTH=503 /DNA_ID=CAMNT_0006876189 /DNA_START=93 /DNA_END=1600 /DNA_ORIENTATION=-
MSAGVSRLVQFITIGCLLVQSGADIYLHNPRGSNNKLNEPQNSRRNANRLFDSQNNNNGGYQVGDNCEPVCSNANGQYDANLPGAGEGVMKFYEGSTLPIEWTAQHGCGPDALGGNAHCTVVIQYMCEDSADSQAADPLGSVIIRDGKSTDTIPANAESANNTRFGRQEPFSYYEACRARERNRGLFTADQNVRTDRGATATRQNPGGNRYGLECAEERDYYPYWHPTPWRDAAVLTSNTSMCEHFTRESENVKARGECSDEAYNNPDACQQAQAEWLERAPHSLPPPECRLAEWSRDNHLGNGFDAQTASYNWTIPAPPPGADAMICVLRVRYNITTGDLAAALGPEDFVDSRYNEDRSPLQNYPEADFVNGGVGRTGPLRLAINTAQYGRVFQDRTHRFRVLRRPPHVPSGAAIHNLNVRGRRGNIVQVYPSVEYDFVPATLRVAQGDFLHVQWTGSDANAKGNDGEGRRMTDRSNFVEMRAATENVPTPLEDTAFFLDAG